MNESAAFTSISNRTRAELLDHCSSGALAQVLVLLPVLLLLLLLLPLLRQEQLRPRTIAFALTSLSALYMGGCQN